MMTRENAEQAPTEAARVIGAALAVGEQPCMVYRYRDADEQLLYVGITVNPERRESEHEMRLFWPLVASASEVWYPDTPTARAAETVAIRTERPLFNKAGVDRAARAQQLAIYLAQPAPVALLAAWRARREAYTLSLGPRWGTPAAIAIRERAWRWSVDLEIGLGLSSAG
jgi:hypothetical protein